MTPSGPDVNPCLTAGLTIRAANAADAPTLSALIQHAVRATNAPDYSPGIIDLICANFTPEQVIQKMAEREVFAGTCDNAIAGTVSIGGGKLHSLFVDPRLQRRGIGVRLVGHLEKRAAASGHTVLWLSSSITARRFYERLGYQLHRFEERNDGSTFLMSKAIY
ncbi:MAG: GNAT family N-acetyltransferase [Methylocella sp.]